MNLKTYHNFISCIRYLFYSLKDNILLSFLGVQDFKHFYFYKLLYSHVF